jgi:hypothetical protein
LLRPSLFAFYLFARILRVLRLEQLKAPSAKRAVERVQYRRKTQPLLQATAFPPSSRSLDPHEEVLPEKEGQHKRDSKSRRRQRRTYVTLVHVALVTKLEGRIVSDEGVLRTHQKRVVDGPVHLRASSESVRDSGRRKGWRAYLADLAGGVEETLEDVGEDNAGTEGDTHRFDGVEHGADNVRTRWEEEEESVAAPRQEGEGRTHSRRCSAKSS